MARRTFDDFDAQLAQRLGNRSDITSAVRAQILNDALLKVSNMYVHRELQSTTEVQLAQGSDFGVVTPEGFWWIENVKDLTGQFPITPGDKDLIESTNKPVTRPTRFYTWANQIYFNCLADEPRTIKIWYVSRPDYWSTEESPLDILFDQLILLWAQKIGSMQVRDLDEADAIGKEIAMYVAGHKLPLNQQNRNDYRAGIQVRVR